MPVKTLPLYQLQNAEFQAFLVDVASLIDDTQNETLVNIKQKMTKALTRLDLGLVQIKKSEHTKEIVNLDKARDNYFRGLMLRVRSENLSPDKNMREHAYKIFILLQHYKKIPQENLRKATELIDNVVKDLRSAEYSPSVDKLSLGGWINTLEQSNQAFTALYNTRRDELAAAEPINIKVLRKELDSDYKELVKVLGALLILHPSEDINAIIAKLNAAIDKWKDVLAYRKGMNKKDDKTPKPKMPPETAPAPIPEYVLFDE